MSLASKLNDLKKFTDSESRESILKVIFRNNGLVDIFRNEPVFVTAGQWKDLSLYAEEQSRSALNETNKP
jgi:hypothetical protein